MDPIGLILLCALFSGLFFLFSLSQASLFSFSISELIFFEKDDKYKKLENLRSKPRLLLYSLISAKLCMLVLFILCLFSLSTNPIIILAAALFFIILGKLIPSLLVDKWGIRESLRFYWVAKCCILVFFPISKPLSSWHFRTDKLRMRKQGLLSMESISNEVGGNKKEMTESNESKILKEIIKFADIEVSDIMRPRIYIEGVEASVSFKELMGIIKNAGYSRMPVYRESIDQIAGILYIKDLLPFIDESDDFNWVKLSRPASFVTENKKIDVLFKELQEKKVHLAIVVDEYGGTSGIVTLEDIMEEVLGDINDEFDESDEDALFQKINEQTYLFDALIPIHDFCKEMQVKEEIFGDDSRDFETLAGFILEKSGHFPQKNDRIVLPPFVFSVEQMDQKRIKKIKVSYENHTKDADRQ